MRRVTEQDQALVTYIRERCRLWGHGAFGEGGGEADGKRLDQCVKLKNLYIQVFWGVSFGSGLSLLGSLSSEYKNVYNYNYHP